MTSAGVPLPAALRAFKEMFNGESTQVLRARHFNEGNLNTLSAVDRKILPDARDLVGRLPEVQVKHGSLAGD
jgi:hypothetical protein